MTDPAPAARCPERTSVDTLLFDTSRRIIETEDVRCCLRTHGMAAIRGVVSKAEARDARDRLKASFDPGRDEVHNPADYMRMARYLQKVVRVPHNPGAAYAGNQVGRDLRMMISPMWDVDTLGMHEIFERLIRFRNDLYGLPPDFAVCGVSGQVWTASRVHHYPSGIGYMTAHSDQALVEVAREVKLNGYFQVVLLLSEKSVDFSRGGGFATLHGRTVILEDAFEIGDIVVYDGRVEHGVELIDPGRSPGTGLEGRLAAFVSLYRDLGGMDEYVRSLHGRDDPVG